MWMGHKQSRRDSSKYEKCSLFVCFDCNKIVCAIQGFQLNWEQVRVCDHFKK